MRFPISTLRIALIGASVLLFGGIAQGQNIIRFVASYGNDANPCTRPQPCRSLQAGVNATPAGSELQVIDSAGYGPNVSITQSITISAAGAQATIATVAGAGININAPGGTVVLRHLRLMGSPGTLAGIVVADANVVRIESCVIDGYGNNGIRWTTTNGGQLHITDTISANNTDNGLRVEGPCPCTPASIQITHSRFMNNGRNGIAMSDGSAVMLSISASALPPASISASIIDTVISGNGEDGISAADSGASVNCDRCTAADNGGDGFHASNGGFLNISHSVARGNFGSGVEARSGGTARVSDSIATENLSFGFRQRTGGIFETIGNNLVRGNGNDVSGTIDDVGGI